MKLSHQRNSDRIRECETAVLGKLQTVFVSHQAQRLIEHICFFVFGACFRQHLDHLTLQYLLAFSKENVLSILAGLCKGLANANGLPLHPLGVLVLARQLPTYFV